jgi:hypothetical protein
MNVQEALETVFSDLPTTLLTDAIGAFNSIAPQYRDLELAREELAATTQDDPRYPIVLGTFLTRQQGLRQEWEEQARKIAGDVKDQFVGVLLVALGGVKP